MALHNDNGHLGETLACQYLTENGYAIMETNWKKGKAEADIIAYKEGLIVFVEVKTRSNTEYGDPEEFVNKKKQRRYIQLANAYVIQHDREEEVRFDIIAIELNDTGHHIEHIENAFSAVGLYLK